MSIIPLDEINTRNKYTKLVVESKTEDTNYVTMIAKKCTGKNLEKDLHFCPFYDIYARKSHRQVKKF